MDRVIFMIEIKALVRAVTGWLVHALNRLGFLATTWVKLCQLS
jgi:hypothetical protein